jgi:uncharacterized membrane protein YbhN (UPF0104 family)
VQGVAWATAASAQAVEKAIEALGLVLLAGPFLWWLPGKLRTQVWWVAGAALLALVVALVVLPRSGRLRNFAVGAEALKRPRAALEIAALTAAGWTLEALMVVATLAGLHLHPPLLPAAAVVLLAVNLAALVPGLPGNLGTFEVSCSLALGAVGLLSAQAVSFALVYHALHTIPVTIAGLLLAKVVNRLQTTEPAARQ